MATIKLSQKPAVDSMIDSDSFVIVTPDGNNRRITLTALRSMLNLLPPVTAADNGKTLKVENGAWAAVTEPDVSQIGM